MNKKGFVLTEVVIVAVFIVTIFIFIYSSIVPLIAVYKDKSEREENIDVVYKLYHIRNMLKKDANSEIITNNSVKIFKCFDLNDQNYCNELMNKIGLSRYSIAYIKSIKDNIDYFKDYNSEIYDYLKKYAEDDGDALLLFDNDEYTIAHIKYSSYNVMGTLPSIITSKKTNITKVYFNSFSKNELEERYNSASVKTNITNSDKGNVLAWLEDDSNNTGKYILYVGSIGNTYLTTGASLFNGYTSLQEVYFNNVDTSLVTDMSKMFYNCSSLERLDLSNFDTSNVTTMRAMFMDCKNLSSLDLSNFDTSKVNNMHDMFNMPNDYSAKLSLIIFGSKFDTSNVITMQSMFADNVSLPSLDLSNFDTSKVENMQNMFHHNDNITTIYVSNRWNTVAVTESVLMFDDCNNLIGGNGTVWNSNYIDKEYARIDEEGSPGYFTKIYLPE